MSDFIVLKKGLDLPVTGAAKPVVCKSIVSRFVAVEPVTLKGFSPRLLVKEGDGVLCGSPVLADKNNPEILMTSPVSGTVKEIVRGEKRKLLAVCIETADKQEAAAFKADASDAASVRKGLLESGLWLQLRQRPYGIIADPEAAPKAIFVSAFNTAPLAADTKFCYGDEFNAIQAGVTAVSRIANVHVSVNAEDKEPFCKLENCELHFFKGKHPAGNVGVQISHICPIQKGQTVWTVSLAGLAAIGKLFTKGKVDLRRKVAVCGPMAIDASYLVTYPGTPMTELAPFYGTTGDETRFVSGDVLSGANVGKDGYLRFQDDQVTLIREGVEKELLGWIRPIRYKQFSNDRSYFSWLMPGRTYDMDTNLHGGPRPFLMNDGYYAKVLPMDIYPVFLAKACLAGDIDKMEKFGIYEVLPEDLALCEFIDPSKNNIQDMIAKGIDLMLKEMA
jgi:Na+-transporting NADH:ubiquinone oxidoreductase subunit A